MLHLGNKIMRNEDSYAERGGKVVAVSNIY